MSPYWEHQRADRGQSALFFMSLSTRATEPSCELSIIPFWRQCPSDLITLLICEMFRHIPSLPCRGPSLQQTIPEGCITTIAELDVSSTALSLGEVNVLDHLIFSTSSHWCSRGLIQQPSAVHLKLWSLDDSVSLTWRVY